MKNLPQGRTISGSGADPIQKTLWLDTQATPASPNGSIGAPYQTWDPQVTTALQNDLSGTWKVCLPSDSLNLGVQTATLAGITKVVMQGINRNSTNLGDFAPEPTFGGPAYDYFDLSIQDYTLGLTLWPDQSFERCDVSNFIIDAGGGPTNVSGVNSSFGTIQAGSVTTNFVLTNCRIGDTQSTGNCLFNGCTFNNAVTLIAENLWEFRDCEMGVDTSLTLAGTSSVNMDKVSEFSLLSRGAGTFNGVIFSLSGEGNAFDLPNANAPDLDFTASTRAILCSTRLTGNVIKNIVVTGGAPLQTFTIDSYNASGHSLTIMFGVTALAVIGNGLARYVFQIDVAGTSISLLSIDKLA